MRNIDKEKSQNQKERFGTTIDRVGFDKLEKALREDDLLERKEEILAKELLQK